MDLNIIQKHSVKGTMNGNAQGSYIRDEEYLRVGNAGQVEAKYQGTAADQRDMSVLGREQVLRVSKHGSQWQNLFY